MHKKRGKKTTSVVSKPSRLHEAYASTSVGFTKGKKKVNKKKINAGKKNRTKANRNTTKNPSKKKLNAAVEGDIVDDKTQNEVEKAVAKKLSPNDDVAALSVEKSRTTKGVEKGPNLEGERQYDLQAIDTNSNATIYGNDVQQTEASSIMKQNSTAIESKTPESREHELPQDTVSSGSVDTNSESRPSIGSDKDVSACSSELNDTNADEWPPKIPITPSSYTVKIAASDTSSGKDEDEEDSSLMIAMEQANNNIAVELDDEIRKDDAHFEKMIDDIKFSDEEDATVPVDSSQLCTNEKNENAADDARGESECNGADNEQMVRKLQRDTKPARETSSVRVESMGRTLNSVEDVFTYEDMLDDNVTDKHDVEDTRYESVATKEAKQELAWKKQEILDLKTQREQELNALHYVREQEMKRVDKIRRLERLVRYTDVMQVQFDARIMQLKNTIDEIQAEMLIADSVARARQRVPLEGGFEEGYENSPIETSNILSSMAERSVSSHSSFVSAYTFPISREQMDSREDSIFSGTGVGDMGFVSSNSSYPNMIKRLVNAYAGRPNLSGRASTESHRLLREKLKKVLDWNY